MGILKTLSLDEVRTLALEALESADRVMSQPETRSSYAAVGAAYARIYEADVARGLS